MPAFPLKILLVLLVTSIVPGCAPRSATKLDVPAEDKAPSAAVPQAVADKSSASGPASPTDPVAKKGFQLGDLLTPFTPPTLQELESSVTWVDRPVVDSIERLREQQSHGKPTGTVEQALAASNDSEDANRLICSVLGRLPESDAEIQKDATLVRHSSMDMKSTNPLMGSSVMEFDIASLTSMGLFSFDRDFQPFASADTVVSWQSSKDRLYDKVVMRDDLTWSDGRPITAHDVAFSFRVIMSRDVPVPAVRSGTDQLKDVHAYDDHTLVYFHKESLATNDWNVNFPIIPQHVYEKSIADDPKLQVSDYHIKLENAPIVGGPFRIVERNFGKDVVLEARPEYYLYQGKQVRRPPHFKKVRFRIITEHSVALLAMKRGDIDEMILQPEQWQTQTKDRDFYEKCTKAYGTEWVNFHFIWNCKTPYFSDKRVRQAMSYAFDHEEMLKTLLYGLYEPANGIYHQSAKWAPPDAAPAYQQDLDKAEALLEEAGWTDSDGDGTLDKEINGRSIPFQFTVLVPDFPDRITLCNLLRESLDQIGVKCDVRPIEFTVLTERGRTHAFDAMFAGLGTGTDPDSGENLWKTDAERNYGQYSNHEVDRLFELGKREFDLKKRQEIYHQIHRLMYDDQPFTWLYFRNSYYAFNKNLRGYVFSPRGPYGYAPGFDSLWKPVVH